GVILVVPPPSTIESASEDPAESGVVRLAVGDEVCWRNDGDDGDLCFAIGENDAIEFNGAALATVSALSGLVSTDDARLTDARTPTAHAASHQHGGSDQIATATSGTANTIPKAGANGRLARSWVARAIKS